MTRIALSELFELARDALMRAGTTEATAALTARALVEADVQGLASHGVTRVASYAAHLRNGRADGRAEPVIVRRKGATMLIDAGTGLAYPACHLAIEQGIALAREHGVAFVAVGNSHHFGAAGQHLEAVAEAGMVGIALGNSPAAMPAWGGKRPLFGTNPIAAVFPRDGRDPLLMDLSLSAVARGKLVVAAREGRPIPLGWALDADGQPTTDPKAALAGSMLPAGGLKGTLLALMIDLLAAALTGSNFGFESDSLLEAEGNVPRVGQAFLIVDPDALAGREHYFRRIEVLVEAMLAEDGVRLPGALRSARRAEAEANGLDLPDTLLATLRTLAGRA